MIGDLDRTIKELLTRELPKALVSPDAVTPITISFAAPDNQFATGSVKLPAVDLFLYDLQENRDLRSNEWQIEQQLDGSLRRNSPPIRVDCSYLVTAWPKAGDGANPVEDEHLLLGEVMKVLLQYPTIPSQVLQGSLKSQEVPLPTTSMQPGRLQSLGEFWQALGGKPKAALTYTVTVAVKPGTVEEAGPPVSEKMLKFRQGVEVG